jgi:hypothetical protein
MIVDLHFLAAFDRALVLVTVLAMDNRFRPKINPNRKRIECHHVQVITHWLGFHLLWQ